MIPYLQMGLKRSERDRDHKQWMTGLLCISLAAFSAAGCRSAQQIAKSPENPSLPAQSAAKTGDAKQGDAKQGDAKTGDAKQGSAAAEAKPGKNDQQLNTDAKQAESDTAKAATDLIAGIKQDIGADPYPPSGEIVNINYSSEERLLTLPGINQELAMLIIHNRPYATPTDLISKHVLTKAEYDRIEKRLTAWDNLWTNPD